MVFNKNSFIKTRDLIYKCQQNQYEVFIFGTSKHSLLQVSVLQGLQIPIYRFVDNSPKKWGILYQGIEVVSPEVIRQSKSPLVIIANTFYTAMFRQLAAMEIKDVYIISDLAGYDFRSVLEDKQFLADCSKDKNIYSQKVLLQEWVGLGDVIIQLGVLEKISECGIECDVITQNPSNYWLLKKIFNNVTLVDRQKFYEDTAYRRSVLTDICNQNYKYAVNFEWEPSSTLGMLNEFNTNINDFKNFWDYQEWINGMCKDDNYLNNLLIEAKQIFSISDDADYDCQGKLGKYINEDTLTAVLPEQYICIGFGAKTWMNAYPVVKLKQIIKELIAKNYYLVLLGAGKSDDIYYDNVLRDMIYNKNQILNLSSKLSISQTLRIIQSGSMYIGIDSGLAHAAYALSKKGVVLISKASKNKYSHSTDKIKYLSYETECEYCGLIKCNRSTSAENYAECISSVSAETIIDFVIMLQQKGEIYEPENKTDCNVSSTISFHSGE